MVEPLICPPLPRTPGTPLISNRSGVVHQVDAVLLGGGGRSWRWR